MIDLTTADKIIALRHVEPGMPGRKAALDSQHEWLPRYPGSGRATSKVLSVRSGRRSFPRAGLPGQPNEVAPAFLLVVCADS
jgi:hypothetical protein